MKEKIKFISLMRDITFKTLWTLGDPETKQFLVRIISKIVGYDVSDFILVMNELGANNYKSIANRVDILLTSKDNLVKINIELNARYNQISYNKNNTYIFKLAGEFYAGMPPEEKYKNDIRVEQINLNGYLNKEKKGLVTLDYVMRDIEYNIIRKGIIIHDIYLPEIKNMCYDTNELYNDLAMFTCNNYQEMKTVAKNDKVREHIMKELQRLGSETEFVDLYDHEEYEEILKADLRKQAVEEGHKKGLEEGIKEGIKEGKKEGKKEGHQEGLREGIEEGITNSVKKMYQKGVKIEEISRLLDLDIQKIKSIIK